MGALQNVVWNQNWSLKIDPCIRHLEKSFGDICKSEIQVGTVTSMSPPQWVAWRTEGPVCDPRVGVVVHVDSVGL